MNDGPLLLVDFNNAAWRASFALRNSGMTDGAGDSTTVLYGLLGELARVMQQHRSNRVLLLADHPDGSALLRKKLYPKYKASRTKDLSDEDKEFRVGVAAGMVTARHYFREAGFQGYFQKTGYEADDLIAAFDVAAPFDDKVIVSTDKDLYQLLTGRVELCRPGAKENRMTLQVFHAMYGISPAHWPVVKALAGCATDNVPGMHGIGEASAVKWVLNTLSPAKTKRIQDYLETQDYALGMSLVKLPFDRRIVSAAKLIDVYTAAKLDAKTWAAVCRAAGVKSIPYPL